MKLFDFSRNPYTKIILKDGYPATALEASFEDAFSPKGWRH